MTPNSQAFIEAVWARLEATGPTDFARKLRLGPDGLQKVRRWRKGGRLDYEDVMRMLEATGWFTMDQVAADAPTAARIPALPLEQLAANDEEILANQESAMRMLQEIRGALVPAASAPRTDPKRKNSQ